MVSARVPSKSNTTVYPNPIKNVINYTSFEPVEQIVIYNFEGQKIDEYQVDKQYKGQIYIKNQPVGMYFIELKSRKSSSKMKIMME